MKHEFYHGVKGVNNRMGESDNWKQKVKDNAVDNGYLSDWYINSVTEDEWKQSQVDELSNDFYCIPKEIVDRKG